jgi:hypothetical protein
MLKIGDSVKFKKTYESMFLSEDIKSMIKQNNGKIVKIENIQGNMVKLCGYEKWFSLNLIEPIKKLI